MLFILQCLFCNVPIFFSLKEKGFLLQPTIFFHVKFFVIFVLNQYIFFPSIISFSLFFFLIGINKTVTDIYVSAM